MCNLWQNKAAEVVTLLLLLLPILSRAGTFTEYLNVNCNEALVINRLGYPTWNSATILKKPRHGTATLVNGVMSFDSLVYQPKLNFQGFDTIVVLCARATQITCDTGIYIINIACSSSSAEKKKERLLKVYQNPAGQFLHVETNFEYASLAIVSLNGKILLRRKGPQARLNIESLIPGYYGLMAIFDDGQWILELFLKN